MSDVRAHPPLPSRLVAVLVLVLLVGGALVLGSQALTAPSRSGTAASPDPSPPATPSPSAPLVNAAPLPTDVAADGGHSGFSFAVIGDIPYGRDQLKSLPGWIDQINAARPALIFHVGDIKNGSTRCDDEYYAAIRAQFDRFTQPLVYTPGDNEWAECHLPANGAYDPLERLARTRAAFFAHPGTTLGHNPIAVASQAEAGFPENISMRREGVEFAVVHLIGANDDLEPWTGLGHDAVTREQVAEESARLANALDVVESTFVAARRNHDRAIVLLEHVDMFSPTFTPKRETIDSPFTPVVRAIIDQASTFDGPVYLFNGDTHNYNSDRPLAEGSRWLTIYPVTGSADNVQRVTVDGSTSSKDWLRVTVNPPGDAAPLTWERMPYRETAAPS